VSTALHLGELPLRISKVRYGTTTLNETRYLSEAEHQLSFDYDCRFELGRSGLHGKLYAIVAWALGHFGPGFIEYPFPPTRTSASLPIH
jgi:hypothetical protein